VGNQGAHWLVAEAGRSHDIDLLDAVLAARRPVQRVGVWDATGGSFAPCTAPAPDCLWSGGTATIAAGGVPRMDAVTLGWRGRLARRAEVGLELGWQHLSGLWAERETRLTTDDEGHWLPPADGIWQSRRMVLADPDAWRRTLSLGAWFRTGLAHSASRGAGGWHGSTERPPGPSTPGGSILASPGLRAARCPTTTATGRP
jgi:hypothetical protein